MKKLYLLSLLLVLSLNFSAKANDEALSFCYRIYEDVKTSQETDRMKAFLDRLDPQIYGKIKSNPAFEATKGIDIDETTQRRCLNIVYGFLAALQIAEDKNTNLQNDFTYCLGYVEKTTGTISGMIHDFCIFEETEEKIKSCKEKNMLRIQKNPLFSKAVQDAAIVNPMQYSLCLASIAEDPDLIEKILIDP